METVWHTTPAVIILFIQMTTGIVSNNNNQSINTNNAQRRVAATSTISTFDENVQAFNVSASYMTTSVHGDNDANVVDGFEASGGPTMPTTTTTTTLNNTSSSLVAPITDSDLQFLRELPVDKLLRIRKTVRFVSHMMTDAWPMMDSPADDSAMPNCTTNAQQQQQFCSFPRGQRRRISTAETGPSAGSDGSGTPQRHAVNADGYLMESPPLALPQQQSSPLEPQQYRHQQQPKQQSHQNDAYGSSMAPLAYASPLMMEQIKCVCVYG